MFYTVLLNSPAYCRPLFFTIISSSCRKLNSVALPLVIKRRFISNAEVLLNEPTGLFVLLFSVLTDGSCLTNVLDNPTVIDATVIHKLDALVIWPRTHKLIIGSDIQLTNNWYRNTVEQISTTVVWAVGTSTGLFTEQNRARALHGRYFDFAALDRRRDEDVEGTVSLKTVHLATVRSSKVKTRFIAWHVGQHLASAPRSDGTEGSALSCAGEELRNDVTASAVLSLEDAFFSTAITTHKTNCSEWLSPATTSAQPQELVCFKFQSRFYDFIFPIRNGLAT
ncbi:unnamed protein product [Angiostrongylus costaricensis]|uniref:Uncharacterized protein n=1 Tax=Angiostrongylus costaricensis TaxID=334426 RepID=A0A0R3PVK6_ANGCS|nr:unnamed protein product [Angiostrongylus costaricensis]